jgi:hypothetical protein
MGGFPIAALLLSVSLGSTQAWCGARSPVLATWIISSENELLKNRLPMLRFTLQMALRQAYNR